MMNPFSRGASAYKSTAIDTRGAGVDKSAMVAMMFEGVLENINIAKGAIEANDTPRKLQAIQKTMKIIDEGLRTSLDLENGGEIAQNLSDLYEYALFQLTMANAKNSTSLLDDLANMFKPLAEAWVLIKNNPPQGGTTVQNNPQPVNNQVKKLAQAFGQNLFGNTYGAAAFAGA